MARACAYEDKPATLLFPLPKTVTNIPYYGFQKPKKESTNHPTKRNMIFGYIGKCNFGHVQLIRGRFQIGARLGARFAALPDLI
jgi:hypothetical protein